MVPKFLLKTASAACSCTILISSKLCLMKILVNYKNLHYSGCFINSRWKFIVLISNIFWTYNHNFLEQCSTISTLLQCWLNTISPSKRASNHPIRSLFEQRKQFFVFNFMVKKNGTYDSRRVRRRRRRRRRRTPGIIFSGRVSISQMCTWAVIPTCRWNFTAPSSRQRLSWVAWCYVWAMNRLSFVCVLLWQSFRSSSNNHSQ